MFKDIAEHKTPQKFKDLPSAVFFRAPMHGEALFYSILPFDYLGSVCNTFRLVERNDNHGHSHSYDLRPTYINPETEVERISVIKIDVTFQKM